MRASAALLAFSFVIALIGPLAAPLAAQPTSLRWRFAPNDHLRWTADQVVQSTRRVSGGKGPQLTTRVETRVNWTWHVLDVADQTSTIGQNVTSIRVSMNVGDGKPLVFDSSQPLPADAAPALLDLRRSFQSWLGKQTVAISSMGEVRVRASANPNNEVDGEKKNEGKAPAGMLSFLNSVMLPLPSKPVSPKAIWRDQIDTSGPSGDIVVRHAFRINSLRDGVAAISMTGAIAMRPVAQQGGPPPLLLADHNLSGAYQFNVRTGTLASTTVKQSMTTRRALESGVEHIVTTSEMKATTQRTQAKQGQP